LKPIMKKIFFSLILTLFFTWLGFAKPIELKERLTTPNKVYKTVNGDDVVVATTTFNFYTSERILDEFAYYYKENSKKNLLYKDTVDINEAKELTSQEVKLLESYPVPKEKMFFEPENVLKGEIDLNFYKHNWKILAYAIKNKKENFFWHMQDDIDYIVNYDEKIVAYINSLPYDKNKTNEENKKAIWQELRENITYDKTSSTYWSTLAEFFNNPNDTKIACQWISNAYWIIINYLGLDDLEWVYGQASSGEYHWLLQSKKTKKYYDLTWWLNSQYYGFYHFGPDMLSTYMTLIQGDNVNFKPNFSNEEIKRIIKENPVTALRQKNNTDTAFFRKELDEKLLVNSLLNSDKITRDEVIDLVLKRWDLSLKDQEITNEELLKMAKKNASLACSNYITTNKENATRSFNYLLEELSPKEIDTFFRETQGSGRARGREMRTKKDIVDVLERSSIREIGFHFKELPFVKKFEQEEQKEQEEKASKKVDKNIENNSIKEEKDVKETGDKALPGHVRILKDYLAKRKLSWHRFYSRVLKVKKKYKKWSFEYSILEDWETYLSSTLR